MTIPAEIALARYQRELDRAEDVGRFRERRVDEEMAWLLIDPQNYEDDAMKGVLASVVRIAFDGKDDKLGRIRDILNADIRRVAEDFVRRDEE